MNALYRLACSSIVLILTLYYSPTLLDFRPTGYNIPLPSFDGPLKENDNLNQAEQLFKGVIRGPESILFHEGDMYTGLEDGRIVKLKGNKVITIARTGRQCVMPHEEKVCGRPLGMRVGRDGLLYVIDAYYGVLNMNFSTGALTRLLPSTVMVEGQKLVFPDDLDIDDDGNIYFSDASRKWDLSTILYLMSEYEGAGRIVRYNIYSGETEVLVRNLYFPNGVQLSRDQKSILIAEMSNRRILRYFIKGAKKGQVEVFADVLPGEPDNIRLGPRGYWVGITSARNNTHPVLVDVLSSYPTIKYIWARFHHACGTLMLSLAELSKIPTLREFAYKFRRGDYILYLIRRHGIVMEFDENGNILRSLQSPDGRISDLAQVTEHQGYLYLGSFYNDYLGRLKLDAVS